ncbi:MAG: PaaI family thioesterase, partial [Mangrovicoccus sp.]
REDLPTREDLFDRSGLEFIQAMLAGEISGPPIAALMNYRMIEAEAGRCVFQGQPQFEHSNPFGAPHGGWYGTILDTCMACAVQTLIPKGSYYTTLEYKVNILRPIPSGTEVLAEGISQHGGRSTGVARGEVRGLEDGKLYATGSTTCIIMQKP